MNAQHLSAETVAGLCESALTKTERSAALSHLAECETCREWLNLHARLSSSRITPSHHRRPTFTATALLAAACAAILLTSFFYLRQKGLPPARNVVTVRRTPPLFAIYSLRRERPPLPYALESVRLNHVEFTSFGPHDFAARSARLSSGGHVALQTPYGERWIRYKAADLRPR
jgi:hypothetical protein